MTQHPCVVRDLSDAEIRAYRDHGVAHIPRLVDPCTTARLLAAADACRADPGPTSSALSADGRFWEERESHLRNDTMRDFVFNAGLARQAGRALGAREVRFYFDHVFMLREDTAKNQYYWHQDMPYWACEGRQLCSFWLALTDCTIDSGALEFVLGTDRGPLYEPIGFADKHAGRQGGAPRGPAAQVRGRTRSLDHRLLGHQGRRCDPVQRPDHAFVARQPLEDHAPRRLLDPLGRRGHALRAPQRLAGSGDAAARGHELWRTARAVQQVSAPVERILNRDGPLASRIAHPGTPHGRP